MTRNFDVVILDIEGTTSPIAFVYDVLFPYARLHLRDYLASNWGNKDLLEDLHLLKEESGSKEDLDLEAAAETLSGFMDEDRKSTALKSVQGKIWAAGFKGGALKGSFFPDVAPALLEWKSSGLTIAVYSSGSVQAQQLLFSSSDQGDLRTYISAWFDTRTGPKLTADSYRKIASEMKTPEGRILFISDNTRELEAAATAGLQVLLARRPGNPDTSESCPFTPIQTFTEVKLT